MLNTAVKFNLNPAVVEKRAHHIFFRVYVVWFGFSWFWFHTHLNKYIFICVHLFQKMFHEFSFLTIRKFQLHFKIHNYLITLVLKRNDT